MKESYIKLPNITVSKLQDVVDYLDENNIEYIEDYKEEVELNKYKEALDKIKDKTNKMIESNNSALSNPEYTIVSKHQLLKLSNEELKDILELLEELR